MGLNQTHFTYIKFDHVYQLSWTMAACTHNIQYEYITSNVPQVSRAAFGI